MIRAPRADELARVAAFIATRQAQAESRDAMFDERADAIAAQLAAWERPWVDTSRVAERKGRLVGFVGVELDDSQSRAWIHGPLVDDADWDSGADSLLASLAGEVPETRHKESEIAADVANERIAAFARRHGFVAGNVHHLVAIAAPAIAGFPRPAIPPLSPEHAAAFVDLHELLFPGTYYSGRQLLDQAARGDAIVLGVVADDVLAGYAAGRIDEAGDGYLDFLGVAPERRRRRLGQALVTAIAHAFSDRHPIAAMRLTVSSENEAALALYEALGFVCQSSAIGYRRPAERFG